MAGAWGCPHENNDLCTKINNLPCDPGMKGCVLAGRYVFFNGDAERTEAKNARLREKQARANQASVETETAKNDEQSDDTKEC